MYSAVADCPPTIVICLEPNSTDAGWIDVATRVKGHIGCHGLDAEVEVLESSLYRQVNLDYITKAPGVGASTASEGRSNWIKHSWGLFATVVPRDEIKDGCNDMPSCSPYT